jgi:hypothetical protein
MAVANFNIPATTLSGSQFALKVAEPITFPNIDGRDAPGKSGSAAKPALVSALAFFLQGDEPGRIVRFALWNSTGTSGFESSNYTIPTGTSLSGVSLSITPRPVFSGVSYFSGLWAVNPQVFPPRPGQTQSELGFRFGMRSGSLTARFDTVAGSTDPNFVSQFSPYGIGGLSTQLTYDILPAQPTSPATSVGGPEDTDITLTWGVVSDDGGQAVSGYRIQRSTDNVNFTTIVANSNSVTRSYTDTNLTPGTTYFYRVAAINAVAIAHGSDYSGPYSPSTSRLVPGAAANNAPSLLTATVTNPEPDPVLFSDFGLGIRFTKIDVQYGSEYLYNEIEATTQDSFAETQIAEAPQSKQLYGVRAYAISNLLNSTDLGAFEVAKDYLTYYYQPELRVQSITVDLSNLTLEEKLQVLNLEIDSYISISFTPNSIGDPKIASGLVTGISHRITITSHEVELRLRTERNLFTLDSDSKGILNVNILGP